MEKLKELISKYKSGKMTTQDQSILEEYLAAGKLDVQDFEDLKELDIWLDTSLIKEPSVSMDVQFYQKLSAQNQSSGRRRILWSNPWTMGIAASLLVLVGFFLGTAYQGNSLTMTERIGSMGIKSKEGKMLRLIHDDLTSDRLNVVMEAAQLTTLSPKMIDALLFAVNFDTNTNVRLASIEALAPYSEDDRVREGLIQSIKNQESPLVVLSLAELLYTIGEKQILEDFKSRLSPEIPTIVADQIEDRIRTLY